jgi:hypothetical protein
MEPARKFRIIVNSKECGTCSGSSPSTVAKKVVKKLCGKSNKMVKFSLKECKRGCERVCGPYQGRMEKLDKPYKRGGKTITHRVVCGKVRKMRGGRDLTVEDFSKDHYIGEFTIKQIDGQNYFFIGHNDDNYTLVYYSTEGTPKSLVILVLFKGTKKLVPVSSADYKRILSEIVGKYIKKKLTQRGNLNIDPSRYQYNSRNYYLYAILQNFCNDLMGTVWFDNNPIKLMNEILKQDNNKLLEYHRKILAKKIAKRFMYKFSDTVQSNEYTDTDFSEILSDESITEKFGLEYEINKKTDESLEDAIPQCRHYLEKALRYFYKNENLRWLKQVKKNRNQIAFSSSPLSFQEYLDYI